MYQSIIARMNKTNLTGEFGDSGNLRVADIAVPPLKPVSPNKPIALLATLMVFGCCLVGFPVGIGFTEQHLMPALRSDNDALPGGSGAAASTSTSLALVPQDSIMAQLPEAVHDGASNLLGEMLRPGTESADILRDLTAQLEARGRQRNGKGPGVILVTSAESGEGKTSISAALAATFCSQGRRVFMIESNAVSPSFHLLFPRSFAHTTWNNELEPLRYGASNLYVLPSQNLPFGEVSDMLENYRSWIEKAREDVDWIILDGAPMMRNLADITPLLPLATEVLMVHDPGRATAEDVNAALNLLRPRLPDGTHCGVVVNRQSA
jgi:Mrp family chromosome partitioning ATPase